MSSARVELVDGRKSRKDMLHQTNRVETIELNLTKIVCRVAG